MVEGMSMCVGGESIHDDGFSPWKTPLHSTPPNVTMWDLVQLCVLTPTYTYNVQTRVKNPFSAFTSHESTQRYHPDGLSLNCAGHLYPRKNSRNKRNVHTPLVFIHCTCHPVVCSPFPPQSSRPTHTHTDIPFPVPIVSVSFGHAC